MRPALVVILSSSLAFAQNAAQTQVHQDMAIHNQQAVQQGVLLRQRESVQVPFTPAPKFSPKPGTFQGSIPPVSITAKTKDAAIYFTTDGSEPTSWSKRYTGPISLSATTTLKAIAIAPSSNPSRTVGAKYVTK